MKPGRTQQAIQMDKIPDDPNGPLTEGQIVAALHNQIYTRMGSRAVVFVNPAQPIAEFSDSTSKEYAEQAKSLNPIHNESTQEAFPPHLFDIVSSAYSHMLRVSQDQSIVLRYSFLAYKDELIILTLTADRVVQESHWAIDSLPAICAISAKPHIKSQRFSRRYFE